MAGDVTAVLHRRPGTSGTAGDAVRPLRRGISHDPRESVTEEDVAVALDVLEHAIPGA